MRVLVAFDKFKDCMDAPAAGEVVARAIEWLHPDWDVENAPLADGGEGFTVRLTDAVGGTLHAIASLDPLGRRILARIGTVHWGQVPRAAQNLLALPQLQPDDLVAVVELAAASGLALLPGLQRDPRLTTTAGTGILIKRAAESGARAIILGLGGSATNDLGAGILSVLGLSFETADGAALTPPTPALWPRIARIDGTCLGTTPPIRIACDVDNPLLGPRGATRIFAPQKGLPAAQIEPTERDLERLARLLLAHTGRPLQLLQKPGVGAAGGTAFGLLAATDALLVPGFELFRAWCDFDTKLARADVVITGEGRFDLGSLSGKGPGGLASLATSAGKRCIVLAGALGPLPAGALPPGTEVRAITPPGLPLHDALEAGPSYLAAAVRAVLPRRRR